MARRHTGRRPGKQDTRGVILAAARDTFAEYGYDAASVRQIATSAGVDPALVHHYFGTKEQLFITVVQPPIDPATVLPQVLEGGIDGIAERMVRTFLSVWEGPTTGPAFRSLLRGAVSHQSRGRLMQEFFSTQIVRRAIPQLATGVDPAEVPLRASLAASQLFGVALARYILEFEPLASMSREAVVAAVAPTIQRYLTGDLSASSPRTPVDSPAEPTAADMTPDRVLPDRGPARPSPADRALESTERMVAMVAAVIFDLDGVLIDSEPVWEEVRRSYVDEHGGRWLPDSQQRLMGMSTQEWSGYLAADLGVDLPPERIAQEVVERVARRYETDLPLMPGAVQAVRRLAGRWRLGLASSSPRPLIERVLAAADLTSVFAVIVSTEEVRRGKPAPDVYLTVTERLAVTPAQAVAIEDSSNGLRSASAAGLLVVAVPHPRYPPAPDALADANLVLRSLHDLTDETLETLNVDPP